LSPLPEVVASNPSESEREKNLVRIAAVIQARMGSTRLPGKILIEISGKPMLEHVIDRVKRSSTIEEVVIATTKRSEDLKIVELGNRLGVNVYTGSEDDVLDRYVRAAEKVQADVIVRITGDCPLIASSVIDEMVQHHLKSGVEYTGNAAVRTFPRGLDVEVVSFAALKRSHKLGKSKHHREHVTPFIYENPDLFKIGNFEAFGVLRAPQFRLCVDTKEDLTLIRAIYEKFYLPDEFVQIEDVIEFLHNNPELAKINIASEKEHLSRNLEDGLRQEFAE